MAIEIKATLKDADKYIKAFREAPELASQEFHDALERSLYRVEANAKKRAPVNKQSGGGNLRQSIYSEVPFKDRGRVAVFANYAIYVHEGTRPHAIQVKNKKILANRRLNQIFGKRVQHPGTRANPFLRDAVDESNDFINSSFLRALSNISKSLTK